MEAGKATQTACDLYLVMDEVGETLGLSEERWPVLSSCKATSPKMRVTQRAWINTWKSCPLVIEHAVKGLEEAMASENRILGEKQLLGTMPYLAGTITIPGRTMPTGAISKQNGHAEAPS